MSAPRPVRQWIARRWPGLMLAVAVLVALAATVVLQNAPPAPQAGGDTPVMDKVINDPGTPAFGPADAAVTVVVFTDYACGVCRLDHQGVETLRRERPDVRFIYKDFPILGPRSVFAARVALAAARQGQYLQVHDALMLAPVPLSLKTVKAAVTNAGADWGRIAATLAADADADGHLVARQLSYQAVQAFSLGLEGTPAYVVGSDIYRGRITEDGLRDAIRRADERAGPG